MLTAVVTTDVAVFVVMVDDAATAEVILESAFSTRGVDFTSVFPAVGLGALFSCDEIPTLCAVVVSVVFVADVVGVVVIVVALVINLFVVTVAVVLVVVVVVVATAFVVAAMPVNGFAPISLAAVVAAIAVVDGTDVGAGVGAGVGADVDFATTLGFAPMT